MRIIVSVRIGYFHAHSDVLQLILPCSKRTFYEGNLLDFQLKEILGFIPSPQ